MSKLRPIDKKRMTLARERQDALPTGDNIGFIHTVLAQCFLPYRDPKQRERSAQSHAQLVSMSLLQTAAETPAGHEPNAAQAAGLSDKLIAPASPARRDPMPPPPPIFPDGGWSVGGLKRSAP